jgi:c-di-GMP-binding flagellar brake protein YcgR
MAITRILDKVRGIPSLPDPEGAHPYGNNAFLTSRSPGRFLHIPIPAQGLFARTEYTWPECALPEYTQPKYVDIVDKPAEIENLLVRFLENQRSPWVQVQLDDPELRYYTCLAKKEGSSDYLRRRRYLLLDPLEPPIGNIFIRSSSTVILRISHGDTLYETEVSFLTHKEGAALCVSFPDIMIREPQKRSAFRAPVEPQWNIAIRTQNDRRPIKAQISDISATGVALFNLSPDPHWTKNTRGQLEFLRNDTSLFQASAQIVSVFEKDGIKGYRARFLPTKSEITRQIEELVTFVQRQQLQRRAELTWRTAE